MNKEKIIQIATSALANECTEEFSLYALSDFGNIYEQFYEKQENGEIDGRKKYKYVQKWKKLEPPNEDNTSK